MTHAASLRVAGKFITVAQYLAHMALVGQAWASSDEGQIPVILSGSHDWGPWMMRAYRWPPQTLGFVLPDFPRFTVTLMAYDKVEDIPWLEDPPSQ